MLRACAVYTGHSTLRSAPHSNFFTIATCSFILRHLPRSSSQYEYSACMSLTLSLSTRRSSGKQAAAAARLPVAFRSCTLYFSYVDVHAYLDIVTGGKIREILILFCCRNFQIGTQMIRLLVLPKTITCGPFGHVRWTFACPPMLFTCPRQAGLSRFSLKL